MANIEHQTRLRLDHYLMETYPEISRGFLQKLCASDQVLVDKLPQKSGYKLKGTEKISVLFDLDNVERVPDIDIPVIYEDENCLIVNKPSGVLSHALSKFHGEASVASFLRQRLLAEKYQTWKASDLRFGIVHRLDRITSGLMICAKNQETMRYLQKSFHDRKVQKTYTAVVIGVLKQNEALVDLPIERNPKAPATFRVGANGKTAQTRYNVLRNSDKYSELELKPITGRTHQLRVHMDYLKHPIVGDFLYNGEKAERLMLHAQILELVLPNNTDVSKFEAPKPAEFERFFAEKDA